MRHVWFFVPFLVMPLAEKDPFQSRETSNSFLQIHRPLRFRRGSYFDEAVSEVATDTPTDEPTTVTTATVEPKQREEVIRETTTKQTTTTKKTTTTMQGCS